MSWHVHVHACTKIAEHSIVHEEKVLKPCNTYVSEKRWYSRKKGIIAVVNHLAGILPTDEAQQETVISQETLPTLPLSAPLGRKVLVDTADGLQIYSNPGGWSACLR